MRALKFGGSSVGNAERMRGVAEIVGQQAPEGPLVVVVSAVGGVTDALLKGAEQAAAGGSVGPALARFHSVHREILDALRPELGPTRAAEAEADLSALERELEDLLRGSRLLREGPPPRSHSSPPSTNGPPAPWSTASSKPAGTRCGCSIPRR